MILIFADSIFNGGRERPFTEHYRRRPVQDPCNIFIFCHRVVFYLLSIITFFSFLSF